VALGTDRGVQIFRQAAGGVLADAGLVAGTAHARWVAALDMDRDGDTDLVASGYEGSTLLTQDGGWFTASLVTTKPTRDVAAGDLDGDGLGDVVSVYGRELTVHHRTGGGWREVRHQMAYVESNAPDGLEVADLSGDGRADLAVALGGNLPDGRLNVFTQTPAGELAAPVTYLTPDMPGALTAADVNGDGRTDLVNVHNGWSRLAALIQAPDGTLGARAFARLPYATWYNRQGLALGDINSDGRPDAVIADYNSGLVVVPNAGGPVPAPDAHVWVTATTPADGATGVPTTMQPRIVVRHRLDPESINYNTVFMIRADGRSAYGDLAYDAATGTITLTPDPPLRPGERYQLVVGRLKTSDGTISEVPAVFHFTTA
jgi:Bacterial Ig-like domain/FG-GAP-like repeat